MRNGGEILFRQTHRLGAVGLVAKFEKPDKEAVRIGQFFEKVPGRCGGRTTLIGRRIWPELIRNSYLFDGDTVEDLAENWDLTVEQVQACIDHREEIENV
jgi:uncharacterized protein (DUF433 family)